MNDAVSRTSAWVNRAGVVLDPTPILGSHTSQNEQGALTREGQGTMPQELTDAMADQAEHQQAKEQAKLLQRFQQLKQWQHQQQERLMRQQQDQLQMLQLEQQRVEQTLVAQRQKQWGGLQQVKQSPPRPHPGPRHPRSPPTGPHGSANHGALANASISLSQTAGPLILNPLLMSAHRGIDSTPDSKADVESTSEIASSGVEEGVYPLPETASEMSYGFIDDEEDAMRLQDEQEEFAKELMEDETGTEENSPNDSLQDAASLNNKLSKANGLTPDKAQVYDEDRPIQSALGSKAKTFEELLELQLKADSETKTPIQIVPQDAHCESPKREFLRKGSGTSRFGVVSRKPPRPPLSRATKDIPTTLDPTVPPGKKSSKEVVNVEQYTKLHVPQAGSNQKIASVGMKKLSLQKPEKREREDDKKKKERIGRDRKEDAPQMSRKVASKPPVVSKTSHHDPLSRERLPKQSAEAAANNPVIVVDTIPAPHHLKNLDKDLPKEGAIVHDDTIEMSFQIRMQELKYNEEVEKEELDLFELLEEAADENASFFSDASVVVNTMQQVIRQKERPGRSSDAVLLPSERLLANQSTKTQAKSSHLSHDLDKDDGYAEADHTITDISESWDSPEAKDRSKVVRTLQMAGSATEEDSDEVEQKINEVPSLLSQGQEVVREVTSSHQRYTKTKPGTKQEDNVNMEKGYRDDAVVADEDADGGEAPGSGDDRDKSTEDEDGTDCDEEDEGPTRAMKRKAVTSSHAADVDFDDDESWGDFGEVVSESSDDEDGEDEEDDDASVILAGAPSATSTPPPAVLKKGSRSVLSRRKEPARETLDQNTMASPPTSSLVSKLFPKLKQPQKLSQEKVQVSQPKAQEPSLAEGLQSKLLKEKLAELEAEVAKFRRENTALAKLREEREKGLAALDKEVIDFQMVKAEELKSLQEYKEEEMKKLKKEKRTFEKYQKAARALPDKKDREEIDLLKNQLSDLQEEISRRETRWTASSTRLRDRIDILEQENTELREEAKLLEQQRLEAWRRDDERAKTKSNPPKPKQQLPVIMKQKIPPLSIIGDPEAEDIRDPQGPRRESLQEKPRAGPAPMTRPPVAKSDDAAVKSFHPQLPNSKSDVAGAKPAAVGSSSDDDMPLSSQPRRPSQRKRSVRFDFEGSPKKPQSMMADESMDLFSPVRDEGHLAAASGVTPLPKMGLHSGGSQILEGNRSLNNNNGEEKEIHHPDGKIEELRSDGSRVITYGNQTRKEISADGQSVIVTFFNGDIKQIMPDQRVMYYYSETQTTHTTYPDGLEILQFNNNQTEKHYPNGTKEITFPDQTIKYLFPNGNEESIFPDGTVLRVDNNGERTMEFPNGQREVHTAQYKRREYPDGTVKTVYPDGRQETRYSTGRIRVKDKDGRVILDKKC